MSGYVHDFSSFGMDRIHAIVALYVLLFVILTVIKGPQCQMMHWSLDHYHSHCNIDYLSEGDFIQLNGVFNLSGVRPDSWPFLVPVDLVTESSILRPDESDYKLICVLDFGPNACRPRKGTGCYCVHADVASLVYTTIVLLKPVAMYANHWVRVLWKSVSGKNLRFLGRINDVYGPVRVSLAVNNVSYEIYKKEPLECKVHVNYSADNHFQFCVFNLRSPKLTIDFGPGRTMIFYKRTCATKLVRPDDIAQNKYSFKLHYIDTCKRSEIISCSAIAPSDLEELPAASSSVSAVSLYLTVVAVGALSAAASSGLGH